MGEFSVHIAYDLDDKTRILGKKKKKSCASGVYV